eukprot:GFYU01002421.1.p2 GENE.GFYU01002421.1~~GFYU01002421.1.p2  ORF type:complete len:105 (+),score=14.91 GFYU01002421.1:484-798(+)
MMSQCPRMMPPQDSLPQTQHLNNNTHTCTHHTQRQPLHHIIPSTYLITCPYGEMAGWYTGSKAPPDPEGAGSPSFEVMFMVSSLEVGCTASESSSTASSTAVVH